MDWKGHQERKEVGPRKRQDPTTNVEGQEQKKELWKGQAGERSTFPWKGNGQRQEQERFHRWRIQQRLEKVHVETVPVIETREIHTLLRAPCG